MAIYNLAKLKLDTSDYKSKELNNKLKNLCKQHDQSNKLKIEIEIYLKNNAIS